MKIDAMKVLGSLLGRKSESSGIGGQILKQIPTGGKSGDSGSGSGFDDLVRDAYSRSTGAQQTPTAPRKQSPRQQPKRTEQHEFSPQSHPPHDDPQLNDDRAVILIRAMVNAAKADGQIDRQEQDKIVRQFGDLSQSEIQFLRDEFARPLDVREFVWEVPVGMEQQVYTVSLMAIDLDRNREAKYLQDLAHGFRFPPNVCNQIHQQLNAPTIS